MEWPAGRNVISFGSVALEKSIEGKGAPESPSVDSKSCKQGSGFMAEAKWTYVPPSLRSTDSRVLERAFTNAAIHRISSLECHESLSFRGWILFGSFTNWCMAYGVPPDGRESLRDPVRGGEVDDCKMVLSLFPSLT